MNTKSTGYVWYTTTSLELALLPMLMTIHHVLDSIPTVATNISNTFVSIMTTTNLKNVVQAAYQNIMYAYTDHRSNSNESSVTESEYTSWRVRCEDWLEIVSNDELHICFHARHIFRP
jgi:hypothetical protein